MGYRDEKLWRILEEKVQQEDAELQQERKVGYEYMNAVQEICDFGIKRAQWIHDKLPLFTLHDEIHICNVLRLMADLLGERIKELTRNEAAMLILAACCHDIGMSCSDEEKQELLDDINRMDKYLLENHSEYIKAYSNEAEDIPMLTPAMFRNYLRSIHHERIDDILSQQQWPAVLNGKVSRSDLIYVCQSHGQDISALDNLNVKNDIDLRMCAVLLRLADILDFDASRAPKSIYEYIDFESKDDTEAKKSQNEWEKHLSSHGVDFSIVNERRYPYELPFNATCKSMQVEQAINNYLDWIDQELQQCRVQMQRFAGKWNNIVLPDKIKRNIEKVGYVSGQYRLSLDQNKVMELLVGKDLYGDPAVFVRELLQNAIDAVRTRKVMDKNLPRSWKPQIFLRSWMDEEGYYWFRIEDNGIGMTEKTIRNFFLKVGCSYYDSDEFRHDKLRVGVDSSYRPISRFGIGLLSCFMGDKKTNRVEVSTRHFPDGKIRFPGLRLSMQGMSGYYYLASDEKRDNIPGPMKGITPDEKRSYLKDAGTAIAVRTNLYQTGKYRGFKEIVDRYVLFPEVPIHYEGPEGSYDYPTESEFMELTHELQPTKSFEKNAWEMELSDEKIEEIQMHFPEIQFQKRPKICIKCLPLDYFTESPFLSGAIFAASVISEKEKVMVKIGERQEPAMVSIGLDDKIKKGELILSIRLVFSGAFEQEMEILKVKYEREFMNNALGNVEKESMKENELFEEYCQKKEPLNVGIDDFVTTEWYQKYFLASRIEGECIAAHNGIFAGDVDFFWGYFFDNTNLGTIILFKDEYRPNLDISRDRIRTLPLEAALEIEVIKKEVKYKEIIEFEGNSNEFVLERPRKIEISKYEEILELRPDFIERLWFSINEEGMLSEIWGETWQNKRMERISTSELRQRIFAVEMLEVVVNDRYMHSWRHNENEELYRCMCMIYCQKEFSLKLELGKNRIALWLSAKDKAEEERKRTFLPMLFVEPLKDYQWLTCKSCNRHLYNAKHKFSRWIIENGEKMKELLPGLYHELLHVLLYGKEEEWILQCNDLLERVNSIPKCPISVPADIFLTEQDFC